MSFSGAQVATVLSVPIVLVLLVWFVCRRTPGLGLVGASFLLGALVLVPVGQLSSLVAGGWAGLTGHYLDELIGNFLTIALPEEIGKGLVALVVLVLSRSVKSPLGWVACGAAAHGGFAAIEGLLGSLGNEGVLKVVVGRSLGTVSHIAWGMIMAWFVWRGSFGASYRWVNWAAALIIPAFLHALTNASMVDVPGAANPADNVVPPPAAMLIVLSGLATLIISLAAAIGCVIHSGRSDRYDGDTGGDEWLEALAGGSGGRSFWLRQNRQDLKV